MCARTYGGVGPFNSKRSFERCVIAGFLPAEFVHEEMTSNEIEGVKSIFITKCLGTGGNDLLFSQHETV